MWLHDDFLKFWAAQAVSGFGSRNSRTVLPVVALLTIDASPAEIGILSALSVAPGVLVGLLMGGRVDRSAKRPLLIGADLVRAALLFTIPIAHWLDLLFMHQLYAVAAGVGAASTLFQMTDNAYLPALIGKPRLLEANAKLEATDAIAEIGGPSIAGILIEIVTAPVAIVFDAISFMVSAVLIKSVRGAEPPVEAEANPPTLVRDLTIGLRAGFGHALVRPLFLVEGNAAFFGGFLLTLYPAFPK